MKLLITGGLGFIGLNFILYWANKYPDDEIISVDKATYASNTEFAELLLPNDNYRFIKTDIGFYEEMEKMAGEVDAIVNFAAETHVDNSIQDSRTFIQSNIVGVHSLLEAARHHDIRFHQVSTDEVYGSLPLNSHSKFNLNSPYNPQNPYSATKAGSDFLVRAYFNTYKLNATISNCGNNFGPMQHPEKLIPKTVIYALTGRKIPIYGDGKQVRDWIYVEDHCTALDAIIKKGEAGRTYLVGNNTEKENIEVVREILKILSLDEDLLEYVQDRKGHDVRYSLDSSVTQKELGWKPVFEFHDALQKTVQHYKENLVLYSTRVNNI